MQTRSRDLFTTIRTEGAILPADLLQRIADGDGEIEGLTPESYHLSGEKLNEAISRSWNRMLGAWSAFVAARAKLPEGDFATTVTRERWLLPLFQELGYGRLIAARAVEIEGKSYPVSHFWQKTPIHLVGAGVDLDHRTPGVSGAARTTPHSLVQELLNRNPNYVWAFVSNGLKLRILRANVSLTRQAYVEFDLESMMEGEVYSDLVVLWLLCHQSRVEAERPDERWLEKWSRSAQQQGTRALDELRKGVEAAIAHLGRGFLSHPRNSALREKLQSGALSKQDYYRQLLRVVYRLLFLFVAEDRQLLLDSQASLEARNRYTRFYSTARLRRLAERIRGTQHGDLWEALALVFGKLGQDTGCPELALPALGSFLWSEKASPDLAGCGMGNFDLLEAIRALAFTTDAHARRPVDYKNLGSEELGSIYESLLELHPELNVDARTFELSTASGHERKATGSYYTPTSLINCLLDSALDPVLQEATRKPNPEEAILRLKVCDPACGSGHFLIAAAHRIAKRLATLRTNDEEPSPEATRTALRDVIGHCIYGVDVNPMAVELCKVGLWLEALEPGKPLSFLEHRIQCGNSLLGATPALLAKGIPDEAFTHIEGDDKEICQKFQKINKTEREITEQKKLDFDAAPWEQLGNLAAGMMNLDSLSDGTIEGIHQKEKLYEETVRSSNYLLGRFWADTWCAAFVWKKTKQFPFAITEEIFRRIQKNLHDVEPWMREEVVQLANQYRLFHWHLAFPDVFRVAGKDERAENDQVGWFGGFDVVLSNPPWERVKIQEKEWFAEREPEIANASNAASRKRLIEALKEKDPAIHTHFAQAVRQAEGESHLLRDSRRYPLCGVGRDINTAAAFSELIVSITSDKGLAGCITPSAIATDETTKAFFRFLTDTDRLVSFYDFENREGIFFGVHRMYKFCLITIAGKGLHKPPGARLLFFAQNTGDLASPERSILLSAADVALFNPNSRTCPIFRTRCDAELARTVYRRIPVLLLENRAEGNLWKIQTRPGLFHMSNDAALFKVSADLLSIGFECVGHKMRSSNETYFPLYEAKLFHQHDHRWATYRTADDTRVCTLQERENPDFVVSPRYWVLDRIVKERLGHNHRWVVGLRDITNSANERTAIATILPPVGIGGTIMMMSPICQTGQNPSLCVATFNSFVFDYFARQKVSGTHLNPSVFKQLPVLPPSIFAARALWDQLLTLAKWVEQRLLELIYTAWDVAQFAQDSDWSGPPFRWNEERRFLLRRELDAAFFHLYLGQKDEWGRQPEALTHAFATPWDAVSYIMDTFPIVKRKDEEKFGEYRTKRVILGIYDAMAEAMRTGVPYQTRLDPPPADPRCCHPRKNIGILAFGSLINDPGEELQPRIVMRIETQTPFPVEYRRYSGKTRGGAPTLVPHESGCRVSAEILVLDDAVSVDEARDILWRRETGKIGSDERYGESTSPNSVLVKEIDDSPWVNTVLYTDFHPTGKIANLTPQELAEHAIESVNGADEGKDGISYLMGAIASGINTPLTEEYKAEIQRQLRVQTLQEALEKARTQ